MCKPATNVFATTRQADSLTRADALEREITDLCAQINAASYRLLQLIAELDDTGPWGTWGLQSCAHWLNWRCGIGMNAAREKVRVAHALKSLPAISSAFESGQLSFSKVRALTRIADDANEAELLELALHATAAQVEKLIRGYRRAGNLEEREQAMATHAARELTYYHDDDGSLVIRARLPAEEGAVVLQALEAAMDAQDTAEDEATAEDVTAETLAANEGGRSELECGQRLAPDIGRKTRAVPPSPSPGARGRLWCRAQRRRCIPLHPARRPCHRRASAVTRERRHRQIPRLDSWQGQPTERRLGLGYSAVARRWLRIAGAMTVIMV